MAKLALTGNEVSLAIEAAQLACAWYREDGRTKWHRDRIAGQKALIAKLTAIGDHAYPYDHHEQMAPTVGRETIMRLDQRAVAKTRRIARAAKKRLPAEHCGE